ncbi:MAG: FHA domain-containing protein [Nannocystis sp.]|nr:FHA domain-containing protein [Nannocystis sp.]
MSTTTLAIKIFYGDQLVDTKTLAQDVIKIGKLKSSHLCLDDESVARMHAVIEVSGEDVRIIDLGSSSGTVLNGQRIDKNAALSDGDVLEFGAYRLEVGFVAEQAAAAPEAAGVAAPMMAAAAAAAAAPVMMARPPIQIDASEFEVQNGSRVAEVVAMYGTTVLDVQHVGQLKNRKSQGPLWLAIGGAAILGGIALFGMEASEDWGGYKDKIIEAQASGGVMPQKPGNGLGGVGIALALLGLIPFGIGMMRMGDFAPRDYTIGEGHDATFHVPPAGLPSPSGFPLVRGSDAEFALNFTQGMTGEVTLDGQTIALSQLVASGRAAAAGSHYTFPLPPGSSCRVTYQDVTFYVIWSRQGP